MSQYPPNYSSDPNNSGNPVPYGQPPYAQPAHPLGYGGAPGLPPDARPTSVTVLAIIGIVWGSMALLCNLIGLAASKMPAGNDSAVNALKNDPALHTVNLVAVVLNLILAIILLGGSIGCLSLKPLARLAMIAYSWLEIILTLISIAVTVVIAQPKLEQMIRTSPHASDPGFRMGAQVGFWGVQVLSVVLLVWPVIILYFMTRQKVKAAFAARAAQAGGTLRA